MTTSGRCAAASVQRAGAVGRACDVVPARPQVDRSARTIAGSSSTTSTVLTAARVQASSRMVSPPPGVAAGASRPPIASAKPRATASPSPRRPAPVAECRSPTRWNGAKSAAQLGRRRPARGRRPRTRRAPPRRPADGHGRRPRRAAARCRAGWPAPARQPDVGEHVRQVLRDVEDDAVEAAERRSAPGRPAPRAATALERRLHHPGLQAARRRAGCRRAPGAGRRRPRWWPAARPLGSRPGDVVLAQAADGGLHRRPAGCAGRGRPPASSAARIRSAAAAAPPRPPGPPPAGRAARRRRRRRSWPAPGGRRRTARVRGPAAAGRPRRHGQLGLVVAGGLVGAASRPPASRRRSAPAGPPRASRTPGGPGRGRRSASGARRARPRPGRTAPPPRPARAWPRRAGGRRRRRPN